MALGSRQVFGQDYDDTYAPVGKYASVRMVLAIVAADYLELHQMDVVNAFLHGDIDTDVFMLPPAGFVPSKPPHHVLHLRKALSRLRQAPRLFHVKRNSLLSSLGFISCLADPYLYTLHAHDSLLFIALYVHDLLIADRHSQSIDCLKKDLRRCFDIKDLVEASVCLGFDIKRHRATRTVTISPSTYTSEVLVF